VLRDTAAKAIIGVPLQASALFENLTLGGADRGLCRLL